MDAREMEQLLRNLDERTGRIQQFLPTLATRDEMWAASDTAAAPLSTRDEMHAAIQAAIAPLPTRDEMHTAIQAAVAPLATKAELGELRQELRETEDRVRRHFDVVAESLRDDIRLIAENQVRLSERVDDGFAELGRDIARLDRRVARLEVSR